VERKECSFLKRDQTYKTKLDRRLRVALQIRTIPKTNKIFNCSGVSVFRNFKQNIFDPNEKGKEKRAEKFSQADHDSNDFFNSLL
jgi:hypothetical protein